MITSIEFHLRPSYRERHSAGSIFIRVIHHRKTCTITTPMRVYPEEWDNRERTILYGKGNVSRYHQLRRIESELESSRIFLEETVDRYYAERREFTASDIIAAYKRRQGGELLLSFITKLSNEMNRQGQERTARAYQTVTNGLIRFAGNPGLQLKQITDLLLKRFEEDMKKKGRSLNTVSFYMRNLRAIYNKAIRERVLERGIVNPFERVYTGIPPTRKRALSKEDLIKLNNLELLGEKNKEQKSLHVAREFFLFGFHARGMSFVDMAYLKNENIKDGKITYRRKKTGQLLQIGITPTIAKIIQSFAEETKDSPYVFPIIRKPGENERLQYESALRTQNNRLKRLGALAQLTMDNGQLIIKRESCEKNCQLSNNVRPQAIVNCQLSSHMARHTWATIAKQEQIPLIIISEALGHTSEKTTAIYLGSFEQSVLDKANRKVERALKKSAG